MKYIPITYERYAKYGMIPGTYCYESMDVQFTNKKFGKLTICLDKDSTTNSSNNPTPLIVALDPMQIKLSCKQYKPNNFYKSTIHNKDYIVFLANGVVFIMDNKWCDIHNIRTNGYINVNA